MSDKQAEARPDDSGDERTLELDPEEIPEYAQYDVVWQSGWRTDEAIEAMASVAKSPEGYHASLTFATVNGESDDGWGPPYLTKREAIDAAGKYLDDWFDGQQETLLARQEAQISQHIKDRSIQNQIAMFSTSSSVI